MSQVVNIAIKRAIRHDLLVAETRCLELIELGHSFITDYSATVVLVIAPNYSSRAGSLIPLALL